MDVFLYFERLIALFHHHADDDVERFGSLCRFFVVLAVYGKSGIVGILHPSALIWSIFFYIDAGFHKVVVELIEQIEFSCQIDHRTSFSLFIDHKKRWNTGCFCYLCVVCAECRSNVYDTGSAFVGSYIISRNNAESFLTYRPIPVFIDIDGLYPRYQLLIFHTYEICSFVFGYDLIRNEFIARFV